MKRSPALLLLLALTGCASGGISTDYDETVDFSRYKTYSWIRGAEGADPSAEERLHRGIERELALKGFRKVAESPDLEIATFASVSASQQIDINSYGYAYGTDGWGPEGSGVNVRNVDIGTLMVDFVDASSKKLIWRTVLTESVGYAIPPAKIDKAATKIIARFPPAAKR